MKKLTKAEFLEGYELGYISDIASIGNRVYGKDPRGMGNSTKVYQVVFCEL